MKYRSNKIDPQILVDEINKLNRKGRYPYAYGLIKETIALWRIPKWRKKLRSPGGLMVRQVSGQVGNPAKVHLLTKGWRIIEGGSDEGLPSIEHTRTRQPIWARTHGKNFWIETARPFKIKYDIYVKFTKYIERRTGFKSLLMNPTKRNRVPYPDDLYGIVGGLINKGLSSKKIFESLSKDRTLKTSLGVDKAQIKSAIKDAFFIMKREYNRSKRNPMTGTKARKMLRETFPHGYAVTSTGYHLDFKELSDKDAIAMVGAYLGKKKVRSIRRNYVSLGI